MNNISIAGNAVAAPESKQSAKGNAIARFRLAVKRQRPDGNGERPTDFFTIKAFGKTAELAGRLIAKGKLVGVTGAMVCETWQDRDGNKRSDWVLHAENFTLMGPRENPVAEEVELF